MELLPGPLARPPAGHARSSACIVRRPPGGLPRARRRRRPPTAGQGGPDEEAAAQRERARRAEDELRDPSSFLEYFLPRPLRLALLGATALSCLVGGLIAATRLLSGGALLEPPDFSALGIDLTGFIACCALLYVDSRGAAARVERRGQVRAAQIRAGDREVFTSPEGERMSRLRAVDADWILRRLGRWGEKDRLPFVGPAKGAILQRLVRERAPRFAVEVGTMAGYSALLIAQAMGPEGRLLSLERDWQWGLAAKRFAWQAAQGEKLKPAGERMAHIDVWLAAAQSARLPADTPIELLFLDGTPREYLECLRHLEPRLAPGALVIADNAGVFAEGGLRDYLAYVRASPAYSSRYMESTLEWRPEQPDGLEVSTYLGPAAGT